MGKREDREAAMKARVKAIVDKAPPLTPEQVFKLRALFSTVERQ